MDLDMPDMTRFLAAATHLGANNVNFQMEGYVYKRRQDGVHILHLRKTYEKILLAARALAAIENPADVYVISSRPMGQRAVLLPAILVQHPSLAASPQVLSLIRSRLLSVNLVCLL